MNAQSPLQRVVLLAVFSCLFSILHARSLQNQDLWEEQTGLLQHHVKKRSFHEIGCLGAYHAPEFSRLNRVCKDCYDLYRDDDIHKLCRAGCFANDTFEKCVDALLIDREKEKIREKVDKALGRL